MRQPPHPLRLPNENPLGEGRTAKVYRWHEGTVLKLFRSSIPRSEIEAEAGATMIAHALGVGAPNVGEIVAIDGSFGLVLERVNGRSMLEQLIRRPADAEGLAMQLADLHARIHSCDAPLQMPSQMDLLLTKVDRADIAPNIRFRIRHALADCGLGHSLCHGDFHPANIMLNGAQHSIIDWNDACRGIPALDVARTTVVLLSAALDSPSLMTDQAQVIEDFHSVYLKRYFRKFPEMQSQYEYLLPIAAAGRLSECGKKASFRLRQIAEQCP